MSNNLSSTFSYKVMAEMARYQGTFCPADISLALNSGGTENIDHTGNQVAMFDGDPVTLAADAALDISGEANESVTAWANNTSYTFNFLAPTIRSANMPEGDNVRLRLKDGQTHTSNSINDQPGSGEKWEDKWIREPHAAATAAGATVNNGNSRTFLVLSQRDGTLSTHLAGNDSVRTTTDFKLPQFDPYTYCPVGLIHVDNTDPSNDFTMGTTDLATTNLTNMNVTISKLFAPVFPHPDNINRY